MSTKRKAKNPLSLMFKLLALIMVIILILSICYFAVPKVKSYDLYRKGTSPVFNYLNSDKDFKTILEDFAYENNLPKNSWNKKLIKFGENYPETRDFVLNYPLKKDTNYEIDLSEYKNAKEMPLLIQWDERWGYKEYAGNIMGLAGCGPTSLSMVAMYLLNDTTLTPDYVAKFSTENGYSTNGNGSLWSLIYEGGEKLGLDVTEIPLVESMVMDNLEEGNPIICIMGPGDFTKGGHYIVLSGVQDGKIKVNDCNSPNNSEKLWEYSRIEGQIKNLWVCKK